MPITKQTNKQTKQKQLSWILFYKTICITFSTVSRGYSGGMGAKVLSCPGAVVSVWRSEDNLSYQSL